MPTHYEGSKQEQNTLNTYIKLSRANETITRYLFPGGKFNGLTVSQFGALETLYHLGPMCQGEIGEKILKSSGNMTLVIDNLEKNGLIERERGKEDRRQVIVQLSAKGKDLISKIFPEHVTGIVNQFDILTQEEQKTLGKLLKKLGTQEKE